VSPSPAPVVAEVPAVYRRIDLLQPTTLVAALPDDGASVQARSVHHANDIAHARRRWCAIRKCCCSTSPSPRST
jgi:hypothetical protein